MKLRHSLRWRIQAWHSALLLFVVGIFCFSTYQMQLAGATHRLDLELDRRLGLLTSTMAQPRPDARRPGPEPREGDRGRRDGDRPPDQRGPERSFEEPPPPRLNEYPEERAGDRPAEDAERPRAGRVEPRDQSQDGAPPRASGPPADVFEGPEIVDAFKANGAAPYYFVSWRRDGNRLVASAQAPKDVPRPELPERNAMTKALRNRAGFREASIYTPPGECLLVGLPTTLLDRQRRELAWQLLGIGSGVLLLGLAGGWLLVARTIRPIGDISAAAARIAQGRLGERIHVSDAKGELGELAGVLNETFARLEAAFAEQERFTSDAAHELRTPVSVILAQTQLALARERSPEEHRATIAACRRAAERMHGLIESLLQLSVLDAGRLAQTRQRCDLAEIGREQLEMLRPLAEERQIALTTELAPSECAADPQQVAQIVVNLLSNAVKFSSPGTCIELASYRENGCAVLRVADGGPGISPGHLPHLFERFYRADDSRNRATGGAGLGLAICKSIAEAHGGSLSVESTVGRGSSFILRLPATGPVLELAGV